MYLILAICCTDVSVTSYTLCIYYFIVDVFCHFFINLLHNHFPSASIKLYLISLKKGHSKKLTLFLSVDQRTAWRIWTPKDWVKLLGPNCGEDVESTAGLQRRQRCVHFPKYSCEMCGSATEDYVPVGCLSQKSTFILECNDDLVHFETEVLRSKRKMFFYVSISDRKKGKSQYHIQYIATCALWDQEICWRIVGHRETTWSPSEPEAEPDWSACR